MPVHVQNNFYGVLSRLGKQLLGRSHRKHWVCSAAHKMHFLKWLGLDCPPPFHPFAHLHIFLQFPMVIVMANIQPNLDSVPVVENAYLGTFPLHIFANEMEQCLIGGNIQNYGNILLIAHLAQSLAHIRTGIGCFNSQKKAASLLQFCALFRRSWGEKVELNCVFLTFTASRRTNVSRNGRNTAGWFHARARLSRHKSCP